MNQLNLFYHALTFYSRIPVGKLDYSEENLAQSIRYFPLVGIIVGGIGSVVFIAMNLFLPQSISVIGALVAMLAATGALHEDGVSDFFDGFGGGYTKERILEIMKDSHVGAYGVIALAVLFLAKYSLLVSLYPVDVPLVLIAAHASSRLPAVMLMKLSTYARSGNSKSSHSRRPLTSTTLTTAFIIGLAPMILMPWQVTATVIVAYTAILMYLKKYVERKIGGFTGDVLGTLQQFSEIAFLMIYIAVAN